MSSAASLWPPEDSAAFIGNESHDRNSPMKRISIVVFALLLSACSRSEFDQIRHEFLAGCTSSGVPESQCECSFEKLQTKYPPEAMIAIQRQGIPPEGFADDVVKAHALCLAGSSQPLKSIAAESAESQADHEANPTGVLSDKEAILRDMAQSATDSESRAQQPESEETVRARYEAEWGQPAPEETLEDIRSRYAATDSILNRRYREAMERLEPNSQQQLKLRQREWLKERDQSCGTTDGQAADKAGYECLIKVVDQRIKVIENLH